VQFLRFASKAHFALAAVVAGAIAAACNIPSNDDADDAGSGSSCPSPVTSCPADVPSYKTEIAPILQATCVPCHSPDGSEGSARGKDNDGTSENTYALVSPQAQEMLLWTDNCSMPPSNGPVMSDAQRAALETWLVCGAPDN
jgi:mono/diheme cytochrome c family protein